MSSHLEQSKNGTLVVIEGDVSYPKGDGNRIIAHCCNNLGLWGSGVVIAFKKRWPKAAETDIEFQKRFLSHTDKLGNVSFAEVEQDINIANMIGQDGVGWRNGIPPVRYDALNLCMQKVAEKAKEWKASIHCPKFGAGRAGGDWKIITKMIEEHWLQQGIDVTVYEFDEGKTLQNDIQKRMDLI